MIRAFHKPPEHPQRETFSSRHQGLVFYGGLTASVVAGAGLVGGGACVAASGLGAQALGRTLAATVGGASGAAAGYLGFCVWCIVHGDYNMQG